MHHESEKLENRRVGRTLGQSVTEACSMKGWSSRVHGCAATAQQCARGHPPAVMYRRGLGVIAREAMGGACPLGQRSQP